MTRHHGSVPLFDTMADRPGECGPQATLYTYPAYSFGGKHRGDRPPPGPGAGKYEHPGVWPYSGAAVYGPPPRRSGPYPHGPMNNPGTAYHKPGALSGERRDPKWTMASRLPGPQDITPGPLDYRASPAWNSTARQHPAPSWGPPSRARPASAPRPVRVEERRPVRAKGPTMGLAYKPIKQDPVPGPLAYQPNCDGRCSQCDGYKGASFGMRTQMFYGRVSGSTPGPAAYHTGCSSIGAATRRC